MQKQPLDWSEMTKKEKAQFGCAFFFIMLFNLIVCYFLAQHWDFILHGEWQWMKTK